MTNHDEFWSRKQSAAVLKHAVLKNYLIPFTMMTAGANSKFQAWFVDGYAGPGQYAPEEGGDSEGQEGSPAVALGVARFVASRTPPRRLRCVFIEQDGEHVRSLEGFVSDHKDVHARVIHGPVQSELAGVVSEMGADPALTFLDPYGTALPYDLMRRSLLARTAPKNEVLLNLHVTSLSRIGGILGRGENLTSADSRTLQRLDTFLGQDEWREVFLGTFRKSVEGSATAAALEVASHFRAKVKKDTGYDSFAVDVRRAEGHVPLFQLTLFYRSGYAAYKFADASSLGHAKWREFNMRAEARRNGVMYADALLGEDYTEEAFEEQFAHDEKALRERLCHDVARNIRELLRSRAELSLSRDSDIKAIYGGALGLAGEKHLRAAWDRLAASGVARRRDPAQKMQHARIVRAKSPAA